MPFDFWVIWYRLGFLKTFSCSRNKHFGKCVGMIFVLHVICIFFGSLNVHKFVSALLGCMNFLWYKFACRILFSQNHPPLPQKPNCPPPHIQWYVRLDKARLTAAAQERNPCSSLKPKLDVPGLVSSCDMDVGVVPCGIILSD